MLIFYLHFLETLLREENKSCGSLVVGAGIVEPCDETLSWDSWDRSAHCDNRTSPRPPRSRHQRRSVPSSEDEPLVPHVPASSHLFAGPLSPVALLHHTPPTTPTIRGRGRKKNDSTAGLILIIVIAVKFPTTPPPRKKHQTNQIVVPPRNLNTDLPLKKSKSDESQLSNKGDASVVTDPEANKRLLS
jgi:hypothetical protein